MASSNNSSNVPSRTSTPNPVPANPRFTSQASTAEDLLKSQTVGLVHLSDFRKRRAEALEQKEREAADRSLGRFTPSSRSGAATPSDGASTPQPAAKKQRKAALKGGLSFALDDDDTEGSAAPSRVSTPRSNSPDTKNAAPASEPGNSSIPKKRLGPNTKVTNAPKVMTKSALLREAQTREQLRKEFLLLQEAVKTTEILIPFVFYDGTNIPGGICKVKKGDHIWLFLDRSRKVGAELGVGAGGGEKANSRREWARVGVDDLMLVRGEIIIPHHYEFYYFIVNKTLSPSSTPLFDFSAQPPVIDSLSLAATATAPAGLSSYNDIARTTSTKNGAATVLDPHLEGFHDDPNLTKVVDRRWYERNKHIFPASVWEQFDPAKDYSKGMRRDAEGNAFFFT